MDKESGEYKVFSISAALKFKILKRYEGKEFLEIIKE